MFPAAGQKVSALGMGCMRMPVLKDGKTIDRPAAIELIRHLIDGGVTYVDTAYAYHDGDSEGHCRRGAAATAIASACTLATKLPVWLVNEHADMERLSGRAAVTVCARTMWTSISLTRWTRTSFEKMLEAGICSTSCDEMAPKGRDPRIPAFPSTTRPTCSAASLRQLRLEGRARCR